jgi:hypothetical protein
LRFDASEGVNLIVLVLLIQFIKQRFFDLDPSFRFRCAELLGWFDDIFFVEVLGNLMKDLYLISQFEEVVKNVVDCDEDIRWEAVVVSNEFKHKS